MSLFKKLIFILFFISLSAHGNALNEKYFIITTQCLIKNISVNTSYKILSETNALLFMETNATGIQALIEAKINIRTHTPCGGFMDVTEEWLAQHLSANSFLKNHEPQKIKSLAHYSIRFPEQVNLLLNQIDSKKIWADLRAFSDTHSDQFPDRYPNSNSGIKAAEWLQQKIIDIAKENNRDDITVHTVATGKRYKQPSVVVKIGDSNAAGIVIGAHIDTLQDTSQPGRDDNVKPGADDDGSGSMTVMGIARTLLASGMHFKKPIYIIWYAAEEEGLVGSSFVVQEFKKIPVEAVIQFDMTGYAYQNNPAMWLVSDYVDTSLTNYLATLIKTYVNTPVHYTRCGYACSDHASWTFAQIRTGFPFEAMFGKDNPHIHKTTDTINRLSLSHITNYTKLGVAFAVELAEPLDIE